MKIAIQWSIIASSVVFSTHAYAASPNVALTNQAVAIFRAQNVTELKEVAGAAKSKQIRERACEIQRRSHLPPTFCYSDDVKDPSELDSLCVSSSAKASRLPRVDRYTSKACRDAIQRRGKDLAYATGENDLRDALR